MIKLTPEEEFTLKLITPHITWEEFISDFDGFPNERPKGTWTFARNVVIDGRLFLKNQIFYFEVTNPLSGVERIVVCD